MRFLVKVLHCQIEGLYLTDFKFFNQNFAYKLRLVNEK